MHLLSLISIQDKAIQLFRAFAPMLCKRPNQRIEESVKEMQGRTFVIEEKLDGERIQLHKRGNEYFYCSRSVVMSLLVLWRLKCSVSTERVRTTRTYMENILGEGPWRHSLTTHLIQGSRGRLQIFVKWYIHHHNLQHSIVLDGEMLVWDPICGRNLPFGTLKAAALGS